MKTMESIGKRIKMLRKKKKLTLDALAGQHMTKGMLSLIENDKSKPSMESLSHIAATLGVGVNELLENMSVGEVRELLDSVKKHFDNGQYELVIRKLKNIVIDDLPMAYESGKLLEIWSKSAYFTGDGEWEEVWSQADDMFMSLHLYNQSARLNHFLVWTNMNQFHYETALKQLRDKQENLENAQAELDTLVELDFHWTETILLFSINHYTEASQKLQATIELSQEKNVLYRIEELYRLAYFYAMMNQKEADMTFYLNKLSLFADFTESDHAYFNLQALRIYYYNSYQHDYDTAIKLIDELKARFDQEDFKYFYVSEKGKALYGKQKYKQALACLLEFEEVTNWNHPFDLSIMYEVPAYIARCYLKLNDMATAYDYAQYASGKVNKFPQTLSKLFIDKTMDLVIKRKNS